MNPINEVQLTAYALGEGSPDERRQIEEQLRDHPDQQAAVEEIRALAARLETELQREPDIALTDAQRQAVLAAPARPADRLARFPLRKLTGFAAIAAAVTLLFGGAFWAATRHLHGTLLAQIDEKGEMAVLQFKELHLDEMLDDLTPPQELAEMVDILSPPVVDLDMAPPPDIQQFAAAPVDDRLALQSTPPIRSRLEMPMEMASRRGADSRPVPKTIAPDAMANRALHSPESGMYSMAPGTVIRQEAVGYARRPNVSGAMAGIPPPADQRADAESYSPIQGNAFKRIADEPLSTFSIDVDTAAYANVRRFLRAGQLPPADAVRIEEMINYFPYAYAPPQGEDPFAVHVESAACPWNPAHALVKIALKGKELDDESRPPCNLVFLLDVSGSMNQPNKLPLVKKSLQLLARQLTEHDRVSIVVYASATGVVLPPTPASDLAAIDAALDNLQAGGSTAGGAGIRLAYDEARKSFLPDGNNRVILCTDGDFNVGIVDSEELATFLADRAKQGIFLTILGYGMGNYKDDRLETLSNKGNGNYAYIDSFSEARKSLVEQAAGTLFAIAKDVKLQIEFNPAHFDSYRLVGYENRLLAKEDFNDDRKDAGELGAGHVVTAFYELVPVGVESTPGVDPLKYQAKPDAPAADAAPAVRTEDASPEWLTVKLRYKLPREDHSTKIEIPFTGALSAFENASADFRFASGVAAAGYLMRRDPATARLAFADVIQWTSAATGPDPEGYRREFIQLLRDAAHLAP
jgi:Ca-activated chloride channel homolog